MMRSNVVDKSNHIQLLFLSFSGLRTELWPQMEPHVHVSDVKVAQLDIKLC